MSRVESSGATSFVARAVALFAAAHSGWGAVAGCSTTPADARAEAADAGAADPAKEDDGGEAGAPIRNVCPVMAVAGESCDLHPDANCRYGDPCCPRVARCVNGAWAITEACPNACPEVAPEPGSACTCPPLPADAGPGCSSCAECTYCSPGLRVQCTGGLWKKLNDGVLICD